MVYERLRNYGQAESAYRRTLSLSKNNIEAVKGIVRIQILRKKYRTSLEFVKPYLENDKDNVEGHLAKVKKFLKVSREDFDRRNKEEIQARIEEVRQRRERVE